MVATVTAAAVNFANSPANPFVFPNISSASSAEGALPPGTLDFRRANQIDMKRSADDAVERDRGAGSRLEHRRPRQLRRVDDRGSDLEPGPQSGAGRTPLGYDAVRHTRPFLDWNVVTTRANDPRSRYDALGLALTKRLSDGLTFDASYTLAKHQSDAGGAVPTAFAAENGATTADLFRGDADYGNVAFTRRHRFVSTFLYELPFGRGRRFASGIGRGLDALVGGWDVTGVMLFQSGPFLTPFFSNADPSGTGANGARLHRDAAARSIGDGSLDNPTAERLLRPRRVRVAGQQHRPLRQCRRSDRSIGPGTRVFSMTIGKAFATGGASRVRVEMAFSNLFNIENLDVPEHQRHVERVRPRHRHADRGSGGAAHGAVLAALFVLSRSRFS